MADLLTNYFTPLYPAVVESVAQEALKAAKGDKYKLVDEISYYVGFHVSPHMACHILQASPNADAYRKNLPFPGDLDGWQEVLSWVAQLAMEADVAAKIKEIQACQEDELANETA